MRALNSVSAPCAGLLCLLALACSSAQQPEAPRAREYRQFLRALSALEGQELTVTEQRLSQVGIDISDHQKAQMVLSPQKQIDVQREVEDKLKPVPIRNGALVPTLSQPTFPYYRPLDAVELATLADRSRSVGRVEVVQNGVATLYGTGFVLPGGGIATNCHVLSEIATFEGGQWVVRPGARVDFGENASHDEKREYEVVGVAATPPARGLDVAVLRVAPTSLSGVEPIPPGLPTSLKPQVATESAPILMGLVGYPNLKNATKSGFVDLLKAGIDGGKIYSPGAVLNIEKIYSLDVLLHVANTLDGSSGSPIFRLDTLEVIGVHNCCSSAGPVVVPANAPSCGKFEETRSFRNLAISTWSAGEDQSLQPFFRAVVSGIRGSQHLDRLGQGELERPAIGTFFAR